MSALAVLILGVSLGADQPRAIEVYDEASRVRLTASADDGTMTEIPEATRILFMLSAQRIPPTGLKQLARLKQVEFLRLNRSPHGDAALVTLVHIQVKSGVTITWESDTGGRA